MMRGVFVTGTDTGIGKTVSACALIAALRARGIACAPMKPVAAGAVIHGAHRANEDSVALIEAAGWSLDTLDLVTPILLEAAMAPHIAAEREKRLVSLAPILAAYETLASRAPFVVAEGVGGFKVPLAPGLDSVELARTLGLPIVLVVGMRLGCLNHALLTRDAIAHAGLPLAGWIANAIDPAMAAPDENLQTLREQIAAPFLGRIPFTPGMTPRAAATALDVSALIAGR
jgi:dethiobiotin synthetase